MVKPQTICSEELHCQEVELATSRRNGNYLCNLTKEIVLIYELLQIK